MKILHITAHFHPNLGGVESHLLDLLKASDKRGLNTFVLTYMPLSNKSKAHIFEKIGKSHILRIPWLRGFFYKLVDYPFLEFLYLFPGLFVFTPFVIMLFRPRVIHAHGIVAGFVACFWGKVFFRRTIISTHSFYNFPKKGFLKVFVSLIFKASDVVLTLSIQSQKEIIDLGVSPSKVRVFTYWVDHDIFTPLNKKDSQKKIGIDGDVIVLFVGRLIEEKGIKVLIKAMNKINDDIKIVVAGDGYLKGYVEDAAKKFSNLKYVGRINQHDLPFFYSASDVVIVPSTHEEGFGRIILESLSCGTPVIASNRGGIKEAMDDSVGSLIDITSESIAQELNQLHVNKKSLLQKQRNALEYAKEHYSEKNFAAIINAYEK